jgi:hypothetical protein
MQQDKRKHTRYEARWKTAIAYSASDKKPIFHTLTHDLSVYGTSVQSNVDEKKDSLLTLLLIPPTINGVAQKVIKLKALVMSSRPFRNGFRLGLSFIHDPELEKLWAIIKSLEHLGQSLPSDPDLANHPAVAPEPAAAQPARPSAPAHAAPPAAPAPASPSAPARDLSASSVLNMIKARTASKLQSEEEAAAAKLAEQRALYKRISDALMLAHGYFTELSGQLNQLKPEYPAAFSILRVADFKNLAWKDDAHADCTPRAGLSPHEERTFDKVALVYTWANAKPMRIEKDALEADKAEAALLELGYEPRRESLRNAQGANIGTAFICPCEVKARLNFGCNDATGMLQLETVNVDRFGKMRYEFAPEALDQNLLDQLTLMMLGEVNSVGKLIKRVA